MKRHGSSWPEPLDAALRVALAKGCTFTQAAAVLKDLFGVELSRSAVGGRAFRLGILADRAATREKALQSLVTARAARQPAKYPPRPKPKVKPMPAPQQFTCDAITGLRQADVVPRLLPLLDLAPDQCRWPYGDGPFVFCGCRVWEASPYCAEHTGLARSSGTRGEQMATRGLERVA